MKIVHWDMNSNKPLVSKQIRNSSNLYRDEAILVLGMKVGYIK